MGGGYAAGKGGLLKLLSQKAQDDPDAMPQGALVIDPDLIKAELPEFQASSAMRPGGEPERRTRRRGTSRSSDGGSSETQAARDRGRDHEHQLRRGRQAREVVHRRGYVNPRINYVSVPTDEAIAARRTAPSAGARTAGRAVA